MSYQDPSSNIDSWLDHCLVTGEPLQDQNEYVLYGYFQGSNMMVMDFPYAIGPKAMDELTDLLSNKTLGEMDDFMGQYFNNIMPSFNFFLFNFRSYILKSNNKIRGV